MSALTLNIKNLFDSFTSLAGWRQNQHILVPIEGAPTLDATMARIYKNAFEISQSNIAQLKFLLASAPMIDVPPNILEARTFIKRVVGSPFAYIHPKTMAKLTFEPISRSFIVFPGSPTKWVLTSLMPEGRVLFSPIPMPGIEKILAQ